MTNRYIRVPRGRPVARKVVYGRISRSEWQSLMREIRDPAYVARVQKSMAGRSSVQYVKDLRRKMEADDRRRRTKRAR